MGLSFLERTKHRVKKRGEKKKKRKKKKEKRKGMETRDLYGDVWISTILYGY